MKKWKLVYLDKYGWPVERVKGRWFLNFIRLLIHTDKIIPGDSFEYEKKKRDDMTTSTDTQTKGVTTNGDS